MATAWSIRHDPGLQRDPKSSNTMLGVGRLPRFELGDPLARTHREPGGQFCSPRFPICEAQYCGGAPASSDVRHFLEASKCLLPRGLPWFLDTRPLVRAHRWRPCHRYLEA